MSVVAVRNTEHGIEIAWDSHIGSGDVKLHGYGGGEAKGELVNGGMAIAGVGCLGDVRSFIRFARTREAVASVDAMTDLHAEFLRWMHERANGFTMESQLIVVCEARAFVLLQDNWSYEVKGFDAIGCGSLAALTAMDLGQSAEAAVESAIKFCEGCSGPVISHRFGDRPLAPEIN